MPYLLSEDKQRALDTEPVFGIAAYVGHYEGKDWIGKHVGVFGDQETAEKWLETGEPKPPVRIYQ